MGQRPTYNYGCKVADHIVHGFKYNIEDALKAGKPYDHLLENIKKQNGGVLPRVIILLLEEWASK